MSDQKPRATGTKFSEFGMTMTGPIDVVGLKDGQNVRATLTTDLVETNPGETFRDAKGRFRSTADYEELTNQLKVNRFIANELDLINGALASLQAGSVVVQDDPPNIEADGQLWLDSNRLELFISYEDAWISTTPIAARVEQGEKIQEQILLEIAHLMGETSALEGRIKVGEGVQQDIQSDVTTLQNKVNVLEGVVGQHRWDYDSTNSNPRPGKMNGKNEAMEIVRPCDQIKYLALNEIDRDDKPVALDKINAGDVIRFYGLEGQYAEYRILDGSDGFYSVELLSATLEQFNNLPYEGVLFSSFDPAGLATTQYVDAQDATKLDLTGGTLTGVLKMQRTDDVSWWNYIRSEKPTAWDGQDSSKQQVHGLVIDIGTTNTYKQQFKITGRNSKSLLILSDDGAAHAEILGVLKAEDIFKDGKTVATEEYVDGQIAGIDIPDAPEPVAFERPVLWKYNPNVMADQLGNGEFNLSADPENGSASDWSIYFAKRDANGHYWYPHDSGNAWTHEIDAQLATIRGRDQNCVHGKTNKWYFNQGTSNYARLRLAYYRSSNPLASGKWYALHIPGYMPYFTFSADAQNNGTHS